MLTFDEDSHTYRWNGNTVPGVTTIIGEWVESVIYKSEYYINTFTGKAVPKEMFTTGADHGTAVHLAVKYLLTGDGLDMESLDSSILAAVNQFQLWKDEYVEEIHVVEEAMYSLKYGYAGTPDVGCTLKRKYGGRRATVDIKTGAHDLSGPQLAAYEQLYKENHKYRAGMSRHVLELPKSGDSFKFIPDTGKDDFRFFLNRLGSYNFMIRR